MASINNNPPVLDLNLYGGDGISFRLICKDETGSHVTIDGDVEAQVRIDRSDTSESIVEFNADLTDGATGVIVLSLTGEQTADLVAHDSTKKGVFNGVWDVQWTAEGAEPRTLCQGKVTCNADVSR